jgi:hypothetical protein
MAQTSFAEKKRKKKSDKNNMSPFIRRGDIIKGYTEQSNKQDTTAACRQGKVKQMYIKSKCGPVIGKVMRHAQFPHLQLKWRIKLTV